MTGPCLLLYPLLCNHLDPLLDVFPLQCLESLIPIHLLLLNDPQTLLEESHTLVTAAMDATFKLVLQVYEGCGSLDFIDEGRH